MRCNKMNLKVIGILSLLILVFSVSLVCAESNDTATLTDSQGSSSDVLSSQINVSGTTFNDVQKSLDKSSKGDVIELDGTYSGNKKPIEVKKDVTIQGSKNGATLDAKKNSAILNINANVVLKDLTFQNSHDSAIQIGSSESKYSVTIINCLFINNGDDETWDGGAIFHANGGKLTIINSTFKNNVADFGGAVYCNNAEIINTQFIGNTAEFEGGAIQVGGADKLTITDCTFSNNKASKDDGGGAIYAFSESTNILRCVFNNNKGVDGGAILAGGNIVIKDSNFTSNSATGKGGALAVIAYLGPSEKIYDKLEISNCNFKKSSAKKQGNSIYATVYNVDIKNSVFDSASDAYMEICNFKNTNNTLKYKLVNSLKAKINPLKYNVKYDPYMSAYKVHITDSEGNTLHNGKVKITIKVGSKTKKYSSYIDDEHPYAYFGLGLSVGKYTAKVTYESKYYTASSVKAKITIKKGTPKVKAKKVTAKYKKSKKFTIKVKNKYEDPIKKLKLKVKIYTGKKYKTYHVKTNKKGIAKINTKKLKRGTHKVVIKSANKNYSINKKSSIRIK